MFERQPRVRAVLNNKVHVPHEVTPSRLKRCLFYLIHRNQHRESRKMKKTEEYVPNERTRYNLRKSP